MAHAYAAFLRGISNVPMRPFRDRLAALGLDDVRSFGTSGNFVFLSRGGERADLERRIESALEVEAVVRSAKQLAAIVDENPYADREGSAVFLARERIEPERATGMMDAGFEGDPPVVSGAQVYFVHPTRRPGRRDVVDFERELTTRGTMRSSNVLARVLDTVEGLAGASG